MSALLDERAPVTDDIGAFRRTADGRIGRVVRALISLLLYARRGAVLEEQHGALAAVAVLTAGRVLAFDG